MPRVVGVHSLPLRDLMPLASIFSYLTLFSLSVPPTVLADVREQDINARVMKTEMFKQLVDNIKKRGQLESLPLCALTDKIEIISGHHRVRAAREAGMNEIIIILDVSGLNRSQVAAKQLAHNAISGFDDQDTLKEIAKLISDVDDMLESFIGKDVLGEPMAELEKLLAPKVEFDWKNITFSFLPHQVNDLQKLISTLELSDPEFVGVASLDAHASFIDALVKYQKFANVKNIGSAIHAMIRATEQIYEDVGFDGSEEWVQLGTIFGNAAVPKESAEVMKQALKKALDDGTVGSKNKWQLIEYMAADYIAGK
jgi:hypothetical protein